MAVVFAAMLALSAVGAASLVSLAVRLLSGTSGASSSLGVLLSALVLVAAVALAFAAAMRRVGLPLGDVVGAADRVARGDYAARIAERGPRFLRVVARAFNGMTERLQEQDRQRRELLADIAHELRTPLAVVQGRLEGLLDGVYARDDARLGEVLEETRVLARLVEDLGTLAQSERGVMALEREPTDLAVLVHDAVRALADEASARGVSLRVEDMAEFPLLDIDPLRIRQVLTNLVGNAIRHSHGRAAVSVSAARRAQAIVVSVSDTGPGIGPDELPRIFDRFQKGARSQGSGLGLAIARNLVVAHGGEMAAESAPGRGTTVSFTIPVPDV
jgi:two-component system OmpR family sensor kinase/two-component system sensor histidine kinase BaeS